MPIPKQLKSAETSKRLPETQIKQGNNHIWQKKTNKSTTTKKPVKVTRCTKPNLWKWIPKRPHEDVSIPKYKWIPKLPTTSPKQSPKYVKMPQQFWQPRTTQDSKHVKVTQRWIPKQHVHYVNLYWAWVPKSLMHIATKHQLQIKSPISGGLQHDGNAQSLWAT